MFKKSKKLEKEFEYYIDHQDKLVEEYNGKVLVIKGPKIIGVFNSEIEAVKETSKTHKPGTFLVQKCEPGSDSYTHTYQSRIAFK